MPTTHPDPPDATTTDEPGSTAAVVTTALSVIGWCAVAAMAIVIGAWVSGHDRLPVLIGLIGLMPVVGLPAYAVAGIAVVTRRRLLAAAATAIVVAHAAALQPVIRPPDAPDPPSRSVRLLVANVYRDNARFDDVLTRIDELRPDVVVLVEFATEHQADFERSRLDERYPVRFVSNDRDYSVGIFGTSGTAHPLIDGGDELPALDIDMGDVTITIAGVHVTAPKTAELAGRWRRTFAELQRLDPSANLVLAGDFNATRWHGPYRELVDDGWIDVHDASGDGLSSSWQPSRFRRLLGPVMRLDHVLTGAGATAGIPSDVAVPGSDHAGILVDIGAAREG